MKDIIVKNVKLNNFRIHENYRRDFDDNTTLILGKNGCGKTSVLEAIYMAMRGKSFRAVDREIIKKEAEYYRVELNYSNGEKVVVVYEQDKKKQFLIKDKKTARLPKLSKYPAILFLPEDLHLLSSSPTRKRDYFDKLISQIDESYSVSLSRYNKVLKQRNEALKNENVTDEMLFSWNLMLAKYGVKIRAGRAEIVGRINERLTEVYRSIAKNEDEVSIEYKSYTVNAPESEYLRLLSLDFERDKITGHTNFGVHKDDFEFIFNNVEADGNASRGEVRSIILALKFIEADLIYEILGKKPIVLLDDVFSELDKTRQKSLIENFKNHQVILTSVEGVDL
ncbi:DNA replication and repair protein RecF [Candidatus Saccharibacteria bacterium]|nr:DNA replication and repair protein RecF [Candidatus Saccharibacteria bacterium]